MFQRIKKAFSRDAAAPVAADSPESQQSQGALSEWAATHGFAFTSIGKGQSLAVESQVGGRPWRMEIGKPTRKYIRGQELRARAELGLDEDMALMIMNRPLKEALEKQAYSMITDPLRTTADPNLPEEMRWLSMYDEVGWDSLPDAFWKRYSVLTDQRVNAMAWVDPELAKLLVSWPEPAPAAEVPFMLLVLRGKAYLRMEYTPADMPVLQHATDVFTLACHLALDALGKR